MRTAHAAVDETSAPGRVPTLHEQIGGVWLEPEAFGRVAVHLWSTLLEFDAPDDLKNLVAVAVVQRAIGYDDV
jgi:hypothetical protein